MPEHPRTGLWLLACALVLGLLGDLLFAPAALGVNMAVWLGGAAALTWALVRGLKLAAPRSRLWLASPALLFALLVAWREAPMLRVLDLAAIAVALSLPMWRPLGGVFRATPGEAAAGLAVAANEAVGGAARLVGLDVQWAALRGSGLGRQAAALGRGLLLALPPVVVFGGLFVAADAGFERTLTTLLDVEPLSAFWHLNLVFYCSWIAAGLLRGVLHERPELRPLGPEAPPAAMKIGAIELVVVLGAIDALFAAFVAHQLPWLFGGSALVAQTQGLTAAEYARRGFFELAAVCGLALPLLFALRWLMGPALGRTQERLYVGLAGGMLALLLVIVASAAQRMAIYQANFGLTELRVYVMAFELWVAGLVVWYAATALRGRTERFVAGAVAWGFAGIVALHVPNMEAAIVRTNVALAHAEHALDARYLATLSDDAVPAIAECLPALDPPARAILARRLAAVAERPDDWRTWSWSAHQARLAAEAAGQLPARAAEAPPTISAVRRPLVLLR